MRYFKTCMLLTLTSTTAPARDLGHLLRKHPDRLHSFNLPFAKAYIFYPAADDMRCTAAMLLDVDPVALVRGRPTATDAGGLVEAYVNDRPYAASSFLSVAISRVLGAALGGRAEDPALPGRVLQLDVTISPLRTATKDLPHRLFAPLGYDVRVEALPGTDGTTSNTYVCLTLSAQTTVQQLLTHIYVLVPVLDGAKHYWIGDDEVDKLFRFGQDWLPSHPEREYITRGYLRRAPDLARAAVVRLGELDSVAGNTAASVAPEKREDALERPMRLQERRLAAVVEVLRESGAQSVADIGCGEADLIVELARDAVIRRLIGVDVCVHELERAQARLSRVQMHSTLRERIDVFQSSVLYWDKRLQDVEALVLMEVIEHIDGARLPALERVLFGQLRPKLAIVTTPNAEYNVLFARLATGFMRHPDHRFEWSRSQFAAWAQRVADTNSYTVRFAPIGDLDPALGAPTQMAVFHCV